MSEPLHIIEELFARDYGTLFEGDVFSILFQQRSAIRGAEFALADGALDCSGRLYSNLSWAERFWDVYDRNCTPERSTLCLFDVKSTLSGEPGSQKFVTSKAQQRRVAFYLCISAADPDFIDLIPNLHQDQKALHGDSSLPWPQGDGDAITVNVSRISRLAPSASGGLDQCGTPCRMPVSLLHEAIERVVRCIKDKVPYVNPWTGVMFDQWRPQTTTNAAWLCPKSDLAQHTAFNAYMEMYKVVRLAQDPGLKMDFVALQPSIGDYKFILEHRGKTVEFFVQDKLDGRARRQGDLLDNVHVSRGKELGKDGVQKQNWYFTALQRFDFLTYHFDFQTPHAVEHEMFFIPEKAIPDDFYTTTDKEKSFEIPQFQPYRLKRDKEGRWVQRVKKIITESLPHPRRSGNRPHRRQDDVQEDAPADELPTVTPVYVTSDHVGRGKYVDLLRQRHQMFFNKMMRLCAERRYGLLIVLATNHPLGDFGYVAYAWTLEEADDFFERGHPPKACHHLPQDQAMVGICYYTRFSEGHPDGHAVTGAQFRRLASCSEFRLVIWDIFGSDSCAPPPPVVIPSEDFGPSTAQMREFDVDLARGNGEGSIHTPILSALLKTGISASRYVLGEGGPHAYDSQDWRELLSLLDQFVGQDELSHPKGHIRKCSAYRHSVRIANQLLANELFSGKRVEEMETIAIDA